MYMAQLANPTSLLQLKNVHTPLHLSSQRNSTIRIPVSILHCVPFPTTVILTSSTSTRRSLGRSSIPVGQSGGEEEQENHRVEATVLKLYAALKSNNIRELLDTLSDECRCVFNLFSFNGKQKVVKIFNNLITFLGKNFEFDVQATLQEGIQVGVSWRLEWKKSHVPLGKGFSLYILQVYQGKVFIRNIEMFMEPLVRIMGLAAAFIDKACYCRLSKVDVKKVMLILISAAVIFIFIKPAMY